MASVRMESVGMMKHNYCPGGSTHSSLFAIFLTCESTMRNLSSFSTPSLLTVNTCTQDHTFSHLHLCFSYIECFQPSCRFWPWDKKVADFLRVFAHSWCFYVLYVPFLLPGSPNTSRCNDASHVWPQINSVFTDSICRGRVVWFQPCKKRESVVKQLILVWRRALLEHSSSQEKTQNSMLNDEFRAEQYPNAFHALEGVLRRFFIPAKSWSDLQGKVEMLSLNVRCFSIIRHFLHDLLWL